MNSLNGKCEKDTCGLCVVCDVCLQWTKNGKSIFHLHIVVTDFRKYFYVSHRCVCFLFFPFCYYNDVQFILWKIFRFRSFSFIFTTWQFFFLSFRFCYFFSSSFHWAPVNETKTSAWLGVDCVRVQRDGGVAWMMCGRRYYRNGRQ